MKVKITKGEKAEVIITKSPKGDNAFYELLEELGEASLAPDDITEIRFRWETYNIKRK